MTGRVIGIDIDPEMIVSTRAKAAEMGLNNVVLQERDFLAEGTGCPDDSVGYVMLFNILHIEEPTALLREAFRIVRPSGKLGVIHWKYDPNTPRGPSLEIRPRPEKCREWAESVGFRFIREETLCCCSYHFGLVFEKPSLDRAR